MTFYKQDIENQIHKSIAKLKPKQVKSVEEYKRVVENQFQQVIDELAPLLKHINNTIAENMIGRIMVFDE